MVRPSQVISEDLVQKLIDDPATDSTTRAALESRLASMQRLASGIDPFAGIPQGADDEGWWTA